MYSAHFGLKELPFALQPDPGFLYLTPQHRSALTMLDYSLLNQSLFCLLTGEVGSGKTLLVRQLIQRLGAGTRVGLISNTSQGFGLVLRWVCQSFAIEPAAGDDVSLYRALVAFLESTHAQGLKALLIVDEAQNLDAAMLEELRVLSNLNADKRLLLQIMLVGQPELRDTLKAAELRQLVQRIGIDFHLKPLDSTETRNYVRHRLQVAGGDPELFDDEAIGMAYESSGGVPRLINQLCDLALVYAYASQRRRVDAATMEQVIEDRLSGGLFPQIQPAVPPVMPEQAAGWRQALRRTFGLGRP